MLKILQVRLQQHVNQELPDVQAGLIKGRGIRYHVGRNVAISLIFKHILIQNTLFLSFLRAYALKCFKKLLCVSKLYFQDESSSIKGSNILLACYVALVISNSL